MFLYGFLTGFFSGAVLTVALMFIFASVRISRNQDDLEEKGQKTREAENGGKAAPQ